MEGHKIGVTVDNAVRSLANQFFVKVAGKDNLPLLGDAVRPDNPDYGSLNRVLEPAEVQGLLKKLIGKALLVKKKEQDVRDARQLEAEEVSVVILGELDFLSGNKDLLRHALDRISVKTAHHRMYNKSVGGSIEEKDLAITLSDDLEDLLGDIDLDAELETMTELRDTRVKTVGMGKKKEKASTETDPTMIRINEVVPTLQDLLIEKGETIARYCMKHIAKTQEFQCLRMVTKDKEGVETPDLQVVDGATSA
ncbi:hypothetical protein KAR91_79650 [Candidatus Pacearchaeota archaeon]|nr:hypothetical protein [Candidatus Pacearchaeota archaeon]